MMSIFMLTAEFLKFLFKIKLYAHSSIVHELSMHCEWELSVPEHRQTTLTWSLFRLSQGFCLSGASEGGGGGEAPLACPWEPGTLAIHAGPHTITYKVFIIPFSFIDLSPTFVLCLCYLFVVIHCSFSCFVIFSDDHFCILVYTPKQAIDCVATIHKLSETDPCWEAQEIWGEIEK